MIGDSVYIDSTAIVEEPVAIGAGSKIWHFVHILPGAKIGQEVILGQNVVVFSTTVIGDRCKIQNNVSLYDGVILQDEVFVGPSVVFTNIINPRAAIIRKKEYKETLIKKGASIGANSTIVCGVTLGEYSFVGAGSVVTKSVKPFELVFGNPAKHRGWVSAYGNKLIFGKDNIAICKETQERYVLENGKVRRDE